MLPSSAQGSEIKRFKGQVHKNQRLFLKRASIPLQLTQQHMKFPERLFLAF